MRHTPHEIEIVVIGNPGEAAAAERAVGTGGGAVALAQQPLPGGVRFTVRTAADEPLLRSLRAEFASPGYAVGQYKPREHRRADIKTDMILVQARI